MSVSLRKSRSRFDFLVLNAIIPLIQDICKFPHTLTYANFLTAASLRGGTPYNGLNGRLHQKGEGAPFTGLQNQDGRTEQLCHETG